MTEVCTTPGNRVAREAPASDSLRMPLGTARRVSALTALVAVLASLLVLVAPAPASAVTPTIEDGLTITPTTWDVIGMRSNISFTGSNSSSPRSEGLEALIAPFADVVERIAGPDRFATTAAVDERVITEGTDTVFVVTGLEFADALTGIPIAAVTRSAVLMVGADGIPPEVATELRRLQPRTIIVLGGTAAVTTQIESLLDQFLQEGTGERIRGMQVTREDIEAAQRSLT